MGKKITPYEIRRANAQAELARFINDVKRRHNINIGYTNDNEGRIVHILNAIKNANQTLGDGLEKFFNENIAGNNTNPDAWIVQFAKTAEDKAVEEEQMWEKTKEGM